MLIAAFCSVGLCNDLNSRERDAVRGDRGIGGGARRGWEEVWGGIVWEGMRCTGVVCWFMAYWIGVGCGCGVVVRLEDDSVLAVSSRDPGI